MKKILAVLAAVAMLGLAACSADPSADAAATSTEAAVASTSDSSPAQVIQDKWLAKMDALIKENGCATFATPTNRTTCASYLTDMWMMADSIIKDIDGGTAPLTDVVAKLSLAQDKGTSFGEANCKDLPQGADLQQAAECMTLEMESQTAFIEATTALKNATK